MSRVMRLEPHEDPWERVQRALWEERQAGRIPLRWTLGRETIARLKATAGPMVRNQNQGENTLLGLPFEIVRQGPPDLFELDAF